MQPNPKPGSRPPSTPLRSRYPISVRSFSYPSPSECFPFVRPVRTANVGRALFVAADRDRHGIRVGLSSPDHAGAPDDTEATIRTRAPADRIAPKDRLASSV